MRVAALAAVLLLAGCGDQKEDHAWLIDVAASPSRRIVARLWCPELCDVPGKTVLTLSPADRAVPVRRSKVEGFPDIGEIPVRDIAATFHTRHVLVPNFPRRGEDEGLAWIDPATLVISAPCLSNGDLHPVGGSFFYGPVTVRYRDTARGRCR
ncbi:hypothetical protein SAMN06297144_1662 [Sphingomonas guangdongensis]|uniref:Lipoprotein n=1 Tax=Sphingomonas guangdongensis TaxID=1141890 RepID=A0A285QXK3_9SPHN|nr:hypothetical protein SAMN06297144_1662 [Sphingomonas guangdongensis]